METRNVFTVDPLQFEVSKLVAALSNLFAGRIRGWRFVEFQGYVKEGATNTAHFYVFINPVGWSPETSFISCRLRKTPPGFSAELGEVLAHHLTMPGSKDVFRFSFNVASVEGMFLLSPKHNDAESIKLFEQVGSR